MENVTVKNAIFARKNSFINLNYGLYYANIKNFIAKNYFTIYGLITNDYSISFDRTISIFVSTLNIKKLVSRSYIKNEFSIEFNTQCSLIKDKF